MDQLTSYFIEVGLSSSVLLLGYLLIRNKLLPRTRRLVLLICLIAPIGASIIQIQLPKTKWVPSNHLFEQPKKANVSDSNKTPFPSSSPSHDSVADHSIDTPPPIISETHKSTINFTLLAYIFISTLLTIRLLISLMSLYQLYKKAHWNSERHIYYITRKNFVGASFFKLILISEHLKESKELESIIVHEKVHADKWHTIDILMAELVTCFFWFNPAFWILKNQIKLNNEYEVDQVITQQLGVTEYANLLIHLSTRHISDQVKLTNSFSFQHTKKRIQKLHHPLHQKTRYLLVMIPFFSLAFWISSCNMDNSESINTTTYTGQPIKSIVTTFISHQNDTESKDMKTVAVANFLPDGSLDEIIQHMTYPYNYENPQKVSLWGATTIDEVPIILDGLSLDIAEYNFLYGNDWPAKYATLDQAHPKYSLGKEGTGFSKKVDMLNNQFPSKITIEPNDINALYGTFHETFSYDENRIKSYEHYVESDTRIIHVNNSTIRSTSKLAINQKSYEFKYNGDLLNQMSDGKVTYEFDYDDNRLTQSKYYLNGKLYNTRKYIYSANGLKERTEIYNVYGDPEYSIHYNYEFY